MTRDEEREFSEAAKELLNNSAYLAVMGELTELWRNELLRLKPDQISTQNEICSKLRAMDQFELQIGAMAARHAVSLKMHGT